MKIHDSAIVHPNAILGDDVQIGPFSIIEEDVVIKQGTKIGSHVLIASGTRLGKQCEVFHGAVLGTIPQDLKFSGEKTTLDTRMIKEEIDGVTTINDLAVLKLIRGLFEQSDD